MFAVFRDLADADNGATAVEYALLVSLIGLVIAAALGTVGVNLSQTFSSVADAL